MPVVRTRGWRAPNARSTPPPAGIPNQASDTLIYHWDLDYDGQTFDAELFGPQIPITFSNDIYDIRPRSPSA